MASCLIHVLSTLFDNIVKSIILYGLCTVHFIKPYRDPVNKCTGLRQGFMKWALNKY